jgi:hypothetical protein
MLIVLWVLRIELTHQELGLLCPVCCLGAFLWVLRAQIRGGELRGFLHHPSCMARRARARRCYRA